MKKVTLYMAIILLISACSSINSPENENTVEGNQVAYGLLGPGPINYGFINDDKDEYRYDGYINQSPSFRTLDRHRQDFGDDQDKIRQIIKDEAGVEPGTVFIIGKDVWVNAKVNTENKKLSQQKKDKLQKVLSKAMQRYEIHLSINE